VRGSAPGVPRIFLGQSYCCQEQRGDSEQQEDSHGFLPFRVPKTDYLM
jgi:hypothetical protein